MSIARLEDTIEPMAERVAGLHGKANGEMDIKIAEIHHLMQNMSGADASARPSVASADSPISSTGFFSREVRTRRTGSTSASNSITSRVSIDNQSYPPTPRETPFPPDPDISSISVKHKSSKDVDEIDRQGHGLIPVDALPRVRSYGETSAEQENRWRRTDVRGSARPVERLFIPSSTTAHGLSPRSATSRPLASPTLSELSSSQSTLTPTLPASSPRISISSPKIPPTPMVLPSLSPTIPPSPRLASSHGGSYSFSNRSDSSYALLQPLPPSALPPDGFIKHTPSSSYDAAFVPKIEFAPDPSHRAIATEIDQLMFEQEVLRDSALLCEA